MPDQNTNQDQRIETLIASGKCTLRELVQKNKRDLRGANLTGASLNWASLNGANLYRASLNGADLTGASLNGASLNGASLNWSSHDLIAEILRQAAGTDPDKRMLAGLLLVSRDWCWEDFLAINHPLAPWAIEVLTPYLKEGQTPPWEVRP